MPRNGNGVAQGVASTFNPAVAGTTIDPGNTGWEATYADLLAMLTQSWSKDGQTTATGSFNMGGSFKITNMANGTAATDAATVGQVAAGAYSVATVGGTADAITLTPSPAITAYATGQNFQFTATGTNTGAVTVAVSGLTTKAVQANSVALVAGDIISGRTYVIRYDGTAFQLFSSKAAVLHTADYAAGSVTLAKMDTTGTAGQVLTAAGGGGAPTWGAGVGYGVCNARLSGESGVPVQTTSGGVSTLYFTPYLGSKVGIYNGSAWEIRTLTQLSIAVPATTNTNYDVFYDYNAGTPQLSLTAWTNSTTRATDLVLLDGIYVLDGTATKRYIGTIRTGAVSGQADFTGAKRFIWNYYNRVGFSLFRADSTDTWTYSTGAWQQANANAANQVEIVCGFIEDAIDLSLFGGASGSATGQTVSVGIGANSTSSSASFNVVSKTLSTTVATPLSARFCGQASNIGRNFYAWLEWGNGSGTQTWYGDNGASSGGTWNAGLIGRCLC